MCLHNANGRFSGSACERKPLECSLDCSGRGVCVKGVKRDECKCTDVRYSGDACEVDRFSCAAAKLDCGADGTCVNGTAANPLPRCQCEAGIIGDRCQIRLCDRVKCQNKGECDKGVCRCRQGFTGKLCETSLCARVKCLNDGECELGKCKCPPQFKGDRCQVRKAEPCPVDANGAQCSGSGVCNTNNGRCKCFGGKKGEKCDQDACPRSADGKVCGGKGRCSEKGTCTCEPGFSGSDCSRDGRNCGTTDRDNCNGNGRCDATFACRCDYGFIGNKCQTKVECAKTDDGKECGGVGGCLRFDNGNGLCLCPPGFKQPNCAKEQERSCPKGKNNRQCSGVGRCEAGNTCTCFFGRTGSACEQRSCPKDAQGNECTGSAQGTCNRETGRCSCNTGFAGAACDKVSLTCPLGDNGEECSEPRGADSTAARIGRCDRATGKCRCMPFDRQGDPACQLLVRFKLLVHTKLVQVLLLLLLSVLLRLK